jgi:hypothetical protein
MKITHLSRDEILARRSATLARLGMDLETARSQWDENGRCLINHNYDDLTNLQSVQDDDYLLNEPT